MRLNRIGPKTEDMERIIMDAYIYKAALICESCAGPLLDSLTPEDDSDYYPQGPTADGGGESDQQQHCDLCHVFLANPLTPDGYKQVQSDLNGSGAVTLDGLSETLRECASFYGFEHWTQPFSDAHEWLRSQPICTYLMSIMDKLSGDDIQDVFQDKMDADGYFKASGWYSDEMETEGW